MKNTRQALPKLLFALLAAIFVVGCSGISDDEEEAETYSVYDVEGLLEWAAAAEANPKVNCTLYADIDMSGYTWTPIGSSYSNGYAGKFDGNGHVISNLTISSSDGFYVGFFGFIDTSGRVENLGLENASISGRSFVGGIAGENTGTIIGCYFKGSVSGSASNSEVGGMAGNNSQGTITACYSTGTVGTGYRVGGIAGNNSLGDSTITGCYSTALAGRSSSQLFYALGGIVGHNNGNVSSCYWSSSNSSGIGETQDGAPSDTTTKVDGSSVTWDDALSAMNAAIRSSGYQYVLNTDNDTQDDEPLKLTKS